MAIKEVAAGIFLKNNSILILRRAPFMSCPGYWEFPGGKLESNETGSECVARELKEELDVDVVVGKFLTENSHEYDFGTVHLSVYAVDSWKGDFRLMVHDKLCWVSVNELEEFPGLLPADIPVAHKLKEIYAG